MDSDETFFRTLADGDHEQGRFGHRQHVHLTWSAISRFGSDGAQPKIGAFLRHVATGTGVPEKYNETVTAFWVRAVSHAMDEGCAGESFGQLVDDHPALLDKELPLRHWSSDALWSEAAKREWVEPDVRPLSFG